MKAEAETWPCNATPPPPPPLPPRNTGAAAAAAAAAPRYVNTPIHSLPDSASTPKHWGLFSQSSSLPPSLPPLPTSIGGGAAMRILSVAAIKVVILHDVVLPQVPAPRAHSSTYYMAPKSCIIPSIMLLWNINKSAMMLQNSRLLKGLP